MRRQHSSDALHHSWPRDAVCRRSDPLHLRSDGVGAGRRAIVFPLVFVVGLLSFAGIAAAWWPSDQSTTLDSAARTRAVMEKYQPVIDRGLQWLARQQFRDGHWEALQGHYPVAMTGLAGLALLAEGSTLHQGRYARELENAVDYLVNRVSKKTGQIGSNTDPREQDRYMYAHGFATLFLAQVYGEETDEIRRKELEKILVGAVDFIGNAQTDLGGWGYKTKREGNNFDEGSVTITQLQALRACKDAGIPVPHEIIEKAQNYLKKSSVVARRDLEGNPLRDQEGVIYSLRQGGGNIRPPLTAAAIACMFSAGEYTNPQAIKWLNYCQKSIPIDQTGRDSFGHWEYTHFYYAQVIYTLGEDRHAKLRPDLAPEETLRWSKYRDIVFPYLANRQNQDGSWSQGYIGPVYTTSLHLLIMQLDKGHLPIFQR